MWCGLVSVYGYGHGHVHGCGAVDRSGLGCVVGIVIDVVTIYKTSFN